MVLRIFFGGGEGLGFELACMVFCLGLVLVSLFKINLKFMQVEIDVKSMHTNFGGRDSSGFGDTATLKNGQISLSTHGL